MDRSIREGSGLAAWRDMLRASATSRRGVARIALVLSAGLGFAAAQVVAGDAPVSRAEPPRAEQAAQLIGDPVPVGGDVVRAPQWIVVARDRRSFRLEPSGAPFAPWGVNYDHDEQGRLIEDYWESEWEKVEEDFGEIRRLGANTVRIHLQLGRFLEAPERPNQPALERLRRLVELAERLGLYVDVTGLGCYHKKDVPDWYDRLDEPRRWAAQARFWEAVAERLADRPGVFCYDLMNEPVVPGDGPPRDDWLGPPFAGKHFVQFVALATNHRERPEIARRWIEQLVVAVRRHDRRRLITVGLVPWSLDRPGLTSGFVPSRVAGPLDFVAVHLYPQTGKLDEAIETLRAFDVGKPVVIEETFPLECSGEELERFLERSRATTAGWIGFYWGKTRAECRTCGDLADALMADWLERFERLGPRFAVPTRRESPIP